MSPHEINNALRRKPFVPFRITLTEGSQYEVPHPEWCMVGSRVVVVGVQPEGLADPLFDYSVSIDPLHIVKLEPMETSVKG